LAPACAGGGAGADNGQDDEVQDDPNKNDNQAADDNSENDEQDDDGGDDQDDQDDDRDDGGNDDQDDDGDAGGETKTAVGTMKMTDPQRVRGGVATAPEVVPRTGVLGGAILLER
jgi:hypothetical protein